MTLQEIVKLLEGEVLLPVLDWMWRFPVLSRLT